MDIAACNHNCRHPHHLLDTCMYCACFNRKHLPQLQSSSFTCCGSWISQRASTTADILTICWILRCAVLSESGAASSNCSRIRNNQGMLILRVTFDGAMPPVTHIYKNAAVPSGQCLSFPGPRFTHPGIRRCTFRTSTSISPICGPSFHISKYMTAYLARWPG